MKDNRLRMGPLLFEVHTFLGAKSLLCQGQDFGIVNTLISALSDVSGKLLTQLSLQHAWNGNGLTIRLAPNQDEANRWWVAKGGSTETHPNDLYALSADYPGGFAFLPVTTIKQIADLLQQVNEESKPVGFPWLFRVPALAAFPCRLSGQQDGEREMMKTAEEKFSRLGNQDERVQQSLYQTGLQSTEYKEEKLYWLDYWNLPGLADYYKQHVDDTNRDNHTASPDNERFMPDSPMTADLDAIKELEKTVGELDDLMRMNRDDTPDGHALRRFLFDQLEIMTLLDLTIDEGVVVRIKAEAPVFWAYYQYIDRLISYYRSEVRRQTIPLPTFRSIREGVIALEWFWHNQTPANFTDDEWLALCEELYSKANDNRSSPIIIKSETTLGRPLMLQTGTEDGLKQVLLSAVFV